MITTGLAAVRLVGKDPRCQVSPCRMHSGTCSGAWCQLISFNLEVCPGCRILGQAWRENWANAGVCHNERGQRDKKKANCLCDLQILLVNRV